MKKFQRRDFLKTASVAAVAASAGVMANCNKKEETKTVAINTNKRYEWKMVTSWPPKFPILGEYAQKIADWIEQMSVGRLKIQVYGGGELVPALEVFDAVSFGVSEMGHCAPYYWVGKSPTAQFFSTIPFGMNARQMNAWLFFGGGLEIWRELYADFNLYPFPSGNTGGQMGGWFNKEIISIKDLKGLKIRMPGLGGKVITKAGATSVLSPGGESYTNLERGVIDALEWIGPYHDYLMGFHKISKYYYYPGWHETCSNLELMVNRDAYMELPEDLKAIISIAAKASNPLIQSAFDAKNTEYYYKLKDEEKVEFTEYPTDVIKRLNKLTGDVVADIIRKDPMSKKAFDSYSKFRKRISSWFDISEKDYI
jgi:TRAP-type mannitol/chloroaromatic compound transport system substrate-binding protein